MGRLRQVLILPDEERSTVDQMFTVLDELYGSRVLASVIRALCFNCKQDPKESVCEFTLWTADPRGLRDIGVLLRDLFLDGLWDPVLKRELLTQVLLREHVSFADMKQEATLRMEAYGEEATVLQSLLGAEIGVLS